MRSILITRPQPVADELATALRREGFEVFLAPMSEYIERDCDMGTLADYQAFIFTSAQAASLFAKREQASFDRPVFAVGDATALAASHAGFRKVYSAQGDSTDILRLLREKKDTYQLKKILHICGEDTAQDLAPALQADGIEVIRAVIYKAEFKDTLPEEIGRALAEGDINTVTLFSARTAANFVRILQQAEMKGVSRDLEAVCLSERVAAELRPLPWRRIQTAKAPRMEAVLDILRTKEETAGGDENQALSAEPVIAAFGGLRPLAARLDMTPSTVQGWRKRGVIPLSRTAEIRQAAIEDGINLDILWKKEDSAMSDENKNSPDNTKIDDGRKHEFHDRRISSDRRVKHTPVDRRGNVHGEDYKGSDRRSGIDRRAYNERQAQRIRDEKWRFVNSMLIKGSIFFLVILYIGAFLMAPELKNAHENAQQVAAMQQRLDLMNERLRTMQQSRGGGDVGNTLNHAIGKIEDTTTAIGSTINTVSHVAEKASQSAAAAAAQQVQNFRAQNGDSETLQSLQNMLSMWGQAGKLKEKGQGKDTSTFAHAMTALNQAMAQSDNNIDALNTTIDEARRRNPDLRQLMGNVGVKDLGAAAMLLALNEFRSNVSSQRPFAQDLMMLHKFAGDDPEMQKALLRLTPYAEHGVLNPEALKTQFKGLASDIVMAKLQGKDLSIKQEMLSRLGKLVKVRKVGDISGETVDAKVARAQLMLDKGNVQGALKELQSLQGAPAQAATPFMNEAEGAVAADNASDVLTQLILQKLSGTSGFSMAALFQGLANDTPNTTPLLGGGAGQDVPYLSPALQQQGEDQSSPFVTP